MKKLKTSFENIGFAGNDLERILNALSLKTLMAKKEPPQYFVFFEKKSK